MTERAAVRVRKGWGRLGSREVRLLVALLLPVAGLWGFIGLADTVSEHETQSVDERVLRALRNPADPADPLGPPWLEELGRDMTALGGIAVLTLITVGVSGALWLARARGASLLVLGATVSGTLVSLVVKGMVSRPRPQVVPQLSYVMTSSFPSGHSMLSAVVYLTLGALLARLSARRRFRAFVIGYALLLTLLVGVSRVYMGVHYPTDVLAGWSLGLAWASLCSLVARALQRRGKVETPAGAEAP